MASHHPPRTSESPTGSTLGRPLHPPGAAAPAFAAEFLRPSGRESMQEFASERLRVAGLPQGSAPATPASRRAHGTENGSTAKNVACTCYGAGIREDGQAG